MKILTIALSTAFLALSIAAPASAEKIQKKTHASIQERSCKAQAARKYSAVHFLKRREFVKQCMGKA